MCCRPWKTAEIPKKIVAGELILKHGEKIVARYASVLPQYYDKVFWIAVFVMVLGILSITVIELMAGNEAKGQA